MTDTVKIDLKRTGAILGALVALWLLTTAARTVLDGRYAKLSDLQGVEAKLDRILDVACEGKEETRPCQMN